MTTQNTRKAKTTQKATVKTHFSRQASEGEESQSQHLATPRFIVLKERKEDKQTETGQERKRERWDES